MTFDQFLGLTLEQFYSNTMAEFLGESTEQAVAVAGVPDTRRRRRA